MFRAYNPVQDRVHREIFAIWIDKSRQTLSQLAIETTLYGQSYTVSPAMAQWWEGDTPVSQPNPSQPLHIDNAWVGPFGDTVVGSIMLDPAYTVSDLWNRDTVRQIRVTEGIHTFQKRAPNGRTESAAIPYYQVVVETQHYRITVRIGKENPFLLYYAREREGRTLSDETWYPLNWR